MFIKFLRYKLNIEEGHLVYISQHGNEYADCFQICHVITAIRGSYMLSWWTEKSRTWQDQTHEY